jgi:hypothetical protein
MVEESAAVLMDDNRSSQGDGDAPPQQQHGRNNTNHNVYTSSNPTIITFKVIHENTGNSHAVLRQFGIPCVLAMFVAVMLATVQDFRLLQQRWLWIVGGATLALVVFENTHQHPHLSKTELLVKICPLGVQRLLRRYDINHHLPLLLTECIQDCILLENVGAFAVTSHVMFRIRRKSMYNNQETIQLVPAFPHACLSFNQCHTLKNQIQASLEGIR